MAGERGVSRRLRLVEGGRREAGRVPDALIRRVRGAVIEVEGITAVRAISPSFVLHSRISRCQHLSFGRTRRRIEEQKLAQVHCCGGCVRTRLGGVSLVASGLALLLTGCAGTSDADAPTRWRA